MAEEKLNDSLNVTPTGKQDLTVTKLDSLTEGVLSGQTLSPEEDSRILHKIDRCLLPIMAVSYLFQFLDKTCLTYASILGLLDDLHLSGNDYSWAGSIYYFGYLIASYPIAGFVMVRLPIAKVISVLLVSWGGILMLTAACHNAEGLLAVRFFLGVAEAAMAPGLTMIIGMWYKRSEQPLRQGAWFLGNTFAGFFGSLVGYAIGHIDTIEPWRAVFLIFGACTVAYSLVVFFFLPDTPQNAWFLSKEDRVKAVLRVEENMTGIKNNQWKKEQVIEALCDMNCWLLILFQLSCNIPNNGIVTFQGIIIKGFGFSTLKTMLLNMVSSAFQLLFVAIATIGSTCFTNSRTYFMAFNMAMSIVGSVLVRQLDTANKYGRLIGVGLSIGYSGNFPLMTSMISSNFGGFTKRTTVSALAFIAYCAGNIVGPYLFFADEAPTYPSGFLGLIVCFCVGFASCFAWRAYLIFENKRRDKLGDGVAEIEDSAHVSINSLDKTDGGIPQFRYLY